MEVFNNNDPNKFIYVKYFTERCIYTNGDEKDKNREYKELFLKANKKSLLYPSSIICDFCYADLPAHWKYLKKCILLNKFPVKQILSELVITDIYKNVAIAYDRTYVKQPVAIFRYCCLDFDTLFIGKTFVGKIGKFFVPQNDEQILVLTDLFCIIKSFASPLFQISIEPTANNVVIPNFSFIVNPKNNKLVKYKNCHVMFCDFGAIVIPHELVHIFDHKNAFVISSIFYRIQGIKKDFFACWELQDSFKIYINNCLYATCKYGIYHFVREEKLRLAFQMVDDRDKEFQFFAPIADREEEKPIFQFPDFTCTDLENFLDYCIEKKRTRIRRV